MRDKIYDQLKNMDDYNVMRVWNEMCDVFQYMDDYIYHMEMFDELMQREKPINVASIVFYGKFNPHDEFFSFNESGDIISSPSVHNLFSVDALADDIAEHEELRNHLVCNLMLSEPNHD